MNSRRPATRSVALPTPSPLTRRALAFGGAALVAVVAGLHFGTSSAAEAAVKIPAPSADLITGAKGPQETAVFAGGCFWGVQGVFQHTRGVLQAVSGYAGGKKETAAYEEVSTGSTGHAEAVQVTFDPKQVSYAQLLQIYFSVIHDPTQLNRQGPDRGTQYRSAVFTSDASQQQVTQKYIAQLDAAKVFPGKIVTQVAPLTGFFAAEPYHQDYATLHPDSGYIATFDLPKIAALKSMFPQWYRDQPVLVMAKRA
jgi:peptide-methionine (S)-S-oxide reductase